MKGIGGFAMKKIIGFVLFCAVMTAFLLPTPALAMWAKTFGTTWNDQGLVWPISSGGYYTSVISSDVSTGMGYSYLARLDDNGVPQWTKKIYITDFDRLSVIEIGENEFLVSGTTRASKDGPDDIVWAKFTVNASTGAFTPVFQKKFGGSGDENGGLELTDDGGFLFVGSSNSYGSGESDKDVLLIKINASGSVQWTKVFHRDAADVSAATIREITGGYMMTASAGEPSSILLARLNASGEPQWVKLYGPGDDTSVSAVIHPLSGNEYLLLGSRQRAVGYFYSTNLIALKLDSSGGIIWAREYEAAGANLTQGVLYENTDGTMIMSGNLLDTTTYQMSLFVMKLESNGNVAWAKKFSGGGNDIGAFARRDDGTYYLSATSNSFTPSVHDMDVLYGKADSDFNLLWTRTFGGPGVESGAFWEYGGKIYITGMSNSWGAGGMDVLAVTLDADGGFPNCPYCKEVSMISTPQVLNTTSLSWTPQTTSLTQRTAGSAQNTTINTVQASITDTQVCYNAPVDKPEISVTPTSVAFGGQTVGTSLEKKVTVKNVGTANLTISSVSSPTAPFSISSGKDKCSGKTLTPSQECEITYKFAPTAEGASAATSVINSNDPDAATVTVELSGTGVVPTCVYNFAPTSKQNIPYRGMTINLMVKGAGASLCPPPLLESSEPAWLTANPPISWKNNQGSVKIIVASNSNSWKPRTGVVTIGNNKFTVGQQGTPCKLGNLVPTNKSFTNAGATGQAIAVTVTPADCSWSSTTDTPSWVFLTQPTGTSPGNLIYDVGENGTSKARIGKITVFLDNNPKITKIFTVKQAK
jgi:hypothetical protein